MSEKNEGILRATLRSGARITASLRYADRFGGTPYEGIYVIRPALSSQMMATKDKTMTDNVTVEEIPIESVSNTAGGNTVIIG